MITQKLKQDIVAILENKFEEDVSVRKVAVEKSDQLMKKFDTPEGTYWFYQKRNLRSNDKDKIYYLLDNRGNSIKTWKNSDLDSIKNDLKKLLRLSEGVLDEDLRSMAIGAAGLGLGAIGAYQMMDKEPPKEPTPQVSQVQQGDIKKPELKAPVAKKNVLSGAIDSLSEMEKYFVKKAIQNGIEGVELVAFLAQVAHETGNFSSMVEQGPKKYFRRYELKWNPQTAKILGNVKPGDGERFKGRSFVQLTGRDNYRRAGQALGLPLEQKPHLLENPSVGFKASLWYWNTRVKSKTDNFEDIEQVTKLINGGLNGLEDRKQKFEKYLSLLEPSK